MCVFVCVCVYLSMCTYMYIYNRYVYVYTYVHTYTCIHTHTRIEKEQSWILTSSSIKVKSWISLSLLFPSRPLMLTFLHDRCETIRGTNMAFHISRLLKRPSAMKKVTGPTFCHVTFQSRVAS